MREIKFRAWSKYKNLMGEVTGFRFSKSQYPFVNVRFKENGKIVDEGYHFGQEDGCDNVILMQFTGRHDKNGREIYEGDIIDMSYTSPLNNKLVVQRYVIEWSNGIYKATFIKDKPYYDRFLWMEYRNVEVIGNIYENPELLKEGE